MAKKTPTNSISLLTKKLNKIEKQLNDLTIKIATSTDTTNSFWNNIQREATILYEEARIVFSSWTKLNVPFFYKKNIQEQIKKIKTSFRNIPVPLFSKYINRDIHKQTLAALINDAIAVYVSGTDMGQKQYIRLLRQTQQLNVLEKEINQKLSEGFQANKSIFWAKKKLRDDLLKKFLDGKYISLINKNGEVEH